LKKQSQFASSWPEILNEAGEAKDIRNICQIKELGQFSAKKRLHLSGGSDTIHNIRGFLWKAYKNVV